MNDGNQPSYMRNWPSAWMFRQKIDVSHVVVNDFLFSRIRFQSKISRECLRFCSNERFIDSSVVGSISNGNWMNAWAMSEEARATPVEDDNKICIAVDEYLQLIYMFEGVISYILQWIAKKQSERKIHSREKTVLLRSDFVILGRCL